MMEPSVYEKAAAYDRAVAVVRLQRDTSSDICIEFEPETAPEAMTLQELDRLSRSLCVCGHAENSDEGFSELLHSEGCPLG